MGFVGVTTGSSSIMAVFPVWAELLDLPTRRLVGYDLPLDAGPERYRALVDEIAADPAHRGALVTTHKMNLWAAAHDRFAEADAFARAAGEVSAITKRDDRLVAHALDPVTAGLALEELIGPEHFSPGAEAVVLGAGGAGLALAWNLLHRADRPRRIVVTDTSAERLAHLTGVLGPRAGATELHTALVGDADEPARLVASAAPGSLVVNATGLGKDRPGSPLPDDAVFPERAVVWEFNYRGGLDFLHQARAQQSARSLTVADGWRYFVHGWSQVVARVFDLTLTEELVDRLAEAAEPYRQ
ncbi:shikimate dehydrogenase [Auraticoccus sp. F435]|uniref:Shikimate dehydrogenase n=2 Tax=Auraticoccus cholistanensis TaxID=2656650 RepID=A0A6A9UTQ9_9ACTN|nr:shikimate dehydrogenase [Auraticoccus cholistanensis]